MTALAILIDDLSAFVLVVDPARASWEQLEERIHARCRELLAQIERVRSEPRPPRLDPARLEAALASTAQSLEAFVRAAREARASAPTELRQLYARLARSYEQLVGCARQGGAIEAAATRQLSPKNYLRNLFHAWNGLFAAFTYALFLDRLGAIAVIGSLAIFFTSLDLLRRGNPAMNDYLMRFPLLRTIARPHEYYRANSSTWYAWGVLAATLVFEGLPVQLGCVVLGLADPAASIICRRVGGPKLWRDRSVAGTLAFLVVGGVAAFAFARLFGTGLTAGGAALMAAGAALGGAVAETFSRRLDDNLTIPFAAALGATLAALLL